jgi:hypothetical protein
MQKFMYGLAKSGPSNEPRNDNKKQWLTKKRSEYWATTPGMRQSKFFTEGKTCLTDPLALGREQYRRVQELVIAH